LGWEAGDEIIITPNYYVGTPGNRWAIGIDQKNVTTVIEGNIAVVNKTTGAQTSISSTHSKWKFRIRCEA